MNKDGKNSTGWERTLGLPSYNINSQLKESNDLTWKEYTYALMFMNTIQFLTSAFFFFKDLQSTKPWTIEYYLHGPTNTAFRFLLNITVTLLYQAQLVDCGNITFHWQTIFIVCYHGCPQLVKAHHQGLASEDKHRICRSDGQLIEKMPFWYW